jgi:hypothetical protein
MKKIPMPKRIKNLPTDDKGRTIPYFVFSRDGAPVDFRVFDHQKLIDCWRFKLCWVCGGGMGAYRAFTVGPMCCINRISAEPPAHYECAEYSVQVCPFLTTPSMVRREADLPEDATPIGSLMLPHNPGTSAIWITKRCYRLADGQGGFVFRMGDPERVEWWHQGAHATCAQVLEAIAIGLPRLQERAAEDGPRAEARLKRQHDALLPHLPA